MNSDDEFTIPELSAHDLNIGQRLDDEIESTEARHRLEQQTLQKKINSTESEMVLMNNENKSLGSNIQTLEKRNDRLEHELTDSRERTSRIWSKTAQTYNWMVDKKDKRHQTTIERLSESNKTTLLEKERIHAATVSDMNEVHSALIESTNDKNIQSSAARDRLFADSTEKLTSTHAASIGRLTSKHSTSIEKLTSGLHTMVSTISETYVDTLKTQGDKHAQTVARLTSKKESEKEESLRSTIQTLQTGYQQQTQQLREQHEGVITEMKQNAADASETVRKEEAIFTNVFLGTVSHDHDENQRKDDEIARLGEKVKALEEAGRIAKESHANELSTMRDHVAEKALLLREVVAAKQDTIDIVLDSKKETAQLHGVYNHQLERLYNRNMASPSRFRLNDATSRSPTVKRHPGRLNDEQSNTSTSRSPTASPRRESSVPSSRSIPRFSTPAHQKQIDYGGISQSIEDPVHTEPIVRRSQRLLEEATLNERRTTSGLGTITPNASPKSVKQPRKRKAKTSTPAHPGTVAHASKSRRYSSARLAETTSMASQTPSDQSIHHPRIDQPWHVYVGTDGLLHNDIPSGYEIDTEKWTELQELFANQMSNLDEDQELNEELLSCAFRKPSASIQWTIASPGQYTCKGCYNSYTLCVSWCTERGRLELLRLPLGGDVKNIGVGAFIRARGEPNSTAHGGVWTSRLR